MPDKKVATQASDGPWERETIITFNDAEKKASYSQLKTKYEEKKAEQQNNPSTVQYQAPETPKEPSQNVQYQTPNAPAEVKTPPTQQNQNQDNG